MSAAGHSDLQMDVCCGTEGLCGTLDAVLS